jgi:hypothetical protein
MTFSEQVRQEGLFVLVHRLIAERKAQMPLSSWVRCAPVGKNVWESKVKTAGKARPVAPKSPPVLPVEPVKMIVPMPDCASVEDVPEETEVVELVSSAPLPAEECELVMDAAAGEPTDGE